MSRFSSASRPSRCNRPKELIGRSVFDIYADDPVALLNAYRVLDGEEVTVVNELASAALETTFAPVRGPGGEVLASHLERLLETHESWGRRNWPAFVSTGLASQR